jgi:ubiquinone/menaquinone biosynthesis C-methylase UbiE
MAASYQNSAWFYDRLSRLVYGNALVRAQVYLLQFIKPDASILIVGGGTGWILDELTKLYPSGLHITYVEVAADMMALSKKRNTGANQLLFINDAIENVPLVEGFDAAITPFLFGNFTTETTHRVFEHIHLLIKPAGLWLNCDFQLTGKWWQRVLLRSMFLFFRIVCHIEASELPDVERCFDRNGYKTMAEKTFFGEFMIAKAYRKLR